MIPERATHREQMALGGQRIADPRRGGIVDLRQLGQQFAPCLQRGHHEAISDPANPRPDVVVDHPGQRRDAFGIGAFEACGERLAFYQDRPGRFDVIGRDCRGQFLREQPGEPVQGLPGFAALRVHCEDAQVCVDGAVAFRRRHVSCRCQAFGRLHLPRDGGFVDAGQ